jgi:hypothetical protein
MNTQDTNHSADDMLHIAFDSPSPCSARDFTPHSISCLLDPNLPPLPPGQLLCASPPKGGSHARMCVLIPHVFACARAEFPHIGRMRKGTKAKEDPEEG